jgi:type VI secretion system protein ImpF
MKNSQAQISSPLLHRLTDDDPGEVVQHDQARYIDYQALRQDIKQHLQLILNTRLTLLEQFDTSNECSRSILNYGISDIGSQYYSIKKHQQALCRHITSTLSHFEPRLQNIYVELLENDDALNRQCRFRIIGTINLKPEPIQAAFESDLDVMRYQFTLDEEA